MERGGYPDFSNIFTQAGYQASIETSMRKAMGRLKKNTPKIVIAEFNFQSDFRDRTSSLESLMATLQRFPSVKVIVFYEKEYVEHFNRLRTQYDFHCALEFPISEKLLEECILNVEE